MGLRVVYCDIVPKLALGNARQAESLHEMLPKVDFLTLHVPETPETANMIGMWRVIGRQAWFVCGSLLVGKHGLYVARYGRQTWFVCGSLLRVTVLEADLVTAVCGQVPFCGMLGRLHARTGQRRIRAMIHRPSTFCGFWVSEWAMARL
jgi:hypothetical protein